MVHRIISSSNLELEEGRDTSNGARSRATLIVAVLNHVVLVCLLLLEVLILLKPEYGFQVGYCLIFLIRLDVLFFYAWILLIWPGRLHSVKGRIQVFIMTLLFFIYPAIMVQARYIDGSMLRFPLVSPLLFVVFLLHATCVAGWSQCRRSATSCRHRCACGGSEIHLQAQNLERETDM